MLGPWEADAPEVEVEGFGDCYEGRDKNHHERVYCFRNNENRNRFGTWTGIVVQVVSISESLSVFFF